MQVWRNSAILLFAIYPTMVQMIGNAFRCYEIASGSAFLAVDFSIACDKEYRAVMFPVASVSLLVYAVGVPLLLYLRLRQHREVLHSPAAEYTLGFLFQARCWESGRLNDRPACSVKERV